MSNEPPIEEIIAMLDVIARKEFKRVVFNDDSKRQSNEDMHFKVAATFVPWLVSYSQRMQVYMEARRTKIACEVRPGLYLLLTRNGKVIRADTNVDDFLTISAVCDLGFIPTNDYADYELLLNMSYHF